jgi:hypothetical protein
LGDVGFGRKEIFFLRFVASVVDRAVALVPRRVGLGSVRVGDRVRGAAIEIELEEAIARYSGCIFWNVS